MAQGVDELYSCFKNRWSNTAGQKGNVTFSTTNPTWTYLGSKLVFRDERPAHHKKLTNTFMRFVICSGEMHLRKEHIHHFKSISVQNIIFLFCDCSDMGYCVSICSYQPQL